MVENKNKLYTREFRESIFKNCEDELKEVIKMLEEYHFYDLLFYVLIKKHLEIEEGKPIANINFSVIDYLLSLILSLDLNKMKFKKPTEEQCEIFEVKIESLWGKSGLLNGTTSSDELLSVVKGQFLIIRGNDYDKHLFDYLEGLFGDYNHYFESKIGFSLSDVIKLYDILKIKKNYIFPFIFEPKNDKYLKICDYLSAEIGENKDFLKGDYAGLFGNKTIVSNKFFVKWQNNYFIFNPVMILRNIKNILENELKKDPRKWNKYDRKRASLLELKSVEYIKRMLPGSKGYVNLKYSNNFETDGLVLYDNNLFIIEAKAGVLRASSKRGAINGLEEDIDKLMIEGYKQALRTKDYIEKNEKAKFIDSKKGEIIIENKKIKRIFLINTTGDFLGPISLYLDIQKNRGKIDENVHFWSIYINDLRVISEIIDFSTQFILFLERRFKLINLPKIKFCDELDVFMDFLYNGLSFDDGKVSGNKIEEYTSVVMDTTLTDKVDRYYWGIGEKPKMNIEDEYRRIIKTVEKINKYGFSEIATFLLSINENDVLSGLNILKEKVYNDKKEHSITFLFGENGIVFFFLLKNRLKVMNKDFYINYSRNKLKQTNLKKCYNLYFDLYENINIKPVDFDIIVDY